MTYRSLPPLIVGFLLVLPRLSFAQEQEPDIPALARQITQIQYDALAAIREKKWDQAAELLKKLQEIADRVLAAPDAATIYKRRASGAKAFIERMKERHPELAKALGGTEPPPEPEPSTPASRPSTPGSVSFVKDIAPLIVRNCLRCHGEQNPRSGFSMYTYNSMLKGGERGDDIVPGKPDESLLILLLQGKEEPRMPPNRALRPDLIQLFVKWVAEGARFDGGERFTPDTPLPDLVPPEEEVLKKQLEAMSDQELMEFYREVADRYWKSALPSEEYTTLETRNFLAFTNADQNTVREMLEAAERTLTAARRMHPYKGTPWRAKLVVFVYKSRYHYSEHTRMVEKRELPYGIYGHFHDAVELPYIACYVPGPTEKITPEIVVALAVGEAYFTRTLTEPPDWLRAALAMHVAESLTRRSEYWTEVKEQLASTLPVSGDQLQALLEGKLPYDEARLLGYALIGHIERTGRAAGVRNFVETVADPAKRRSFLSDERSKAFLAGLAAALTAELEKS